MYKIRMNIQTNSQNLSTQRASSHFRHRNSLSVSPVQEFQNNLWWLGTEEEQDCRTGPPGLEFSNNLWGQEPIRNRVDVPASQATYRLAGRCDNLVPTQFLDPIYCSKIPAQRLRRLAELISWNRFLGSLKVKKIRARYIYELVARRQIQLRAEVGLFFMRQRSKAEGHTCPQAVYAYGTVDICAGQVQAQRHYRGKSQNSYRLQTWS